MVAEHGCPHVAECIVDVLVPPILEEFAKVAKTVLQEQIFEQASEVPKTSSRDRTLQRAVEQILDVPVPEMVTQWLEVPKIKPQDRILQRTVRQAEATQVLQSETSGADGQTSHRQGRLVVQVRSPSSHGLSRTQTKLEGKCVSVGVDALAVAR